jgi:predicted esterase
LLSNHGSVRLMRSLLILSLLASAGFGAVFDPGARPLAQTPFSVDGSIHYRTYEPLKDAPSKPIGHCVLVHGYGVTQKSLDSLFSEKDTIAKLTRIGLAFSLMSPEDAFAHSAWGPGLLARLREEVCDRLTVVVQETAQTTLLELTERTEKFLREKVCGADTSSCALVGHSKGATVLLQIARRCMEAQAGLSLLGAESCRRISHIYTSAANPFGTGTSAILLGAHLENSLPTLSLYRGLVETFNRLPDAAFATFTGPSSPGQNNPSWFDASPMTKLEKGVSLYAVSRNLVLSHRGWFRAKYAASASAFPYVDHFRQTIGCGTRYRTTNERRERFFKNLNQLVGGEYQPKPIRDNDPSLIQKIAEDVCDKFDTAVSALHAGDLRAYFDKGVIEMVRLSALPLDRVLTWERYQKSDGIVEADFALYPCLKADAGVATQCRLFEGLDAVNHLAMSGPAMQIADDIAEQLLQ